MVLKKERSSIMHMCPLPTMIVDSVYCKHTLFKKPLQDTGKIFSASQGRELCVLLKDILHPCFLYIFTLYFYQKYRVKIEKVITQGASGQCFFKGEYAGSQFSSHSIFTLPLLNFHKNNQEVTN